MISGIQEMKDRTKQEKEQIKEQRVRHRLMMKMLERFFQTLYDGDCRISVNSKGKRMPREVSCT